MNTAFPYPYKAVWIIFLIDVTLHISLEYRNTKKQYRRLAWILSVLLYLTLVPVIFHRPEEEGAILQVWEFLHGKFYHLILLLILSLLNLSNGLVRLLGRRTNPSLILHDVRSMASLGSILCLQPPVPSV